jgi:hypothetical protein
MNKLRIILGATFCSLAWAATAQDTNALKTSIGGFENQTGVVIIKGFGQTGTVVVGADVISVRSKESQDVSTGKKVYGLSIDIAGSGLPRERAYVDYDEIDPLLNGIEYLSKITYDVSPLPGFEASFTTKAGLQVIAHSIRREGTIQTYLQYDDHPRILLTTTQLMQFRGLIQQARENLDSIRTGK